MADPVALPPEEAAQLFYAGTTMAFANVPNEPFVCGRWMDHYALMIQLPFDDATAYFTQHPAIVYDPNPPVPPPPAVSASISVGQPYTPALRSPANGRR